MYPEVWYVQKLAVSCYPMWDRQNGWHGIEIEIELPGNVQSAFSVQMNSINLSIALINLSQFDDYSENTHYQTEMVTLPPCLGAANVTTLNLRIVSE